MFSFFFFFFFFFFVSKGNPFDGYSHFTVRFRIMYFATEHNIYSRSIDQMEYGSEKTLVESTSSKISGKALYTVSFEKGIRPYANCEEPDHVTHQGYIARYTQFVCRIAYLCFLCHFSNCPEGFKTV